MLFYYVPDDAKPIKDVEFWYRLVVDEKQQKARFQLRINPKCYSHDLSYLLRLAAELKRKLRELPILCHEIDDQMTVTTLEGPRCKHMPSLRVTAAIKLSDLTEVETALRAAGFYKTDDIFE